jgi:hypothetical protein
MAKTRSPGTTILFPFPLFGFLRLVGFLFRGPFSAKRKPGLGAETP